MSEEIEIAGIKVPKADWEATPASIQAVVTVLSERLSHLEEKLNKNSQNSSKPPSTDGFGKPGKGKGKGKKQTRKGRENDSSKSLRQVRKRYPVEACKEVYEVIPEVCSGCGRSLSGSDSQAHRHQVIELPPILPTVFEYRLHQLTCGHCGESTRASLPAGVSPLGYGERLSAIVAMLSGSYRQSHRQVQALMKDLFNVTVSRGGVGRLRQEMSLAVREPVAESKCYVQSQAVKHSDETSFAQGNRDGQNPQKKKGWLWVLATPLVSFFEVVLSRSQDTAKALIGETFFGIVNSDRYSAYRWIDLGQWQVCWAHLKRDLTAITERSGVSKEIGEALLTRQKRLFRWWYQLREGTLSREAFIERVNHLRAGFKAELEEAASLPIAKGEKSPLAKTVRTCRQLLKVEPALWTFVYTPGVEPTNNIAERALRPAVIWQRTSFGSQSKSGSQFVARMLTVTASLKAQDRNILDFLTQACHAARLGLPPPSLIPQTSSPDMSSSDSPDMPSSEEESQLAA